MIEAADVSSRLREILRCIEGDCAALVKDETASQELEESEALASDVRELETEVMARATRRHEEKRKAKEHAALWPQCVGLKEKLDAASREIEPANQAYLIADRNLVFARERLAQHVANPPPESDYPSPARIRRWNLERQRLEGIVEERRKELVARKAERDEVQNRHLRLTREFAAISLRERQLRPPEKGREPIAIAWRAAPISPEIAGIGPNR
jgi:hypothetical protein